MTTTGAEGPASSERALLRDIAGDEPAARRRAVAKAITLLESTLPAHRERADRLLLALPPPAAPALRLGISGVPGVGKSTLVEALGLDFIGRGRRVAVLAVDPSSAISGGSILGDKTRMDRLSVHESAFVRPSPSGGTLGGVAAATREAILVVEAAGFDIIIVETVGIGQSEAAVAAMTDLFMLLQLPNAGDELQAIKRGVMELADLVVVNKADLDAAATERAAGQIEAALHLVARPAGDAPRVHRISALRAGDVATIGDAVDAQAAARRVSGRFDARRKSQIDAWLRERIASGLSERFRADPDVAAAWPATLEAVHAGGVPVSVAARRLLAAFGSGGRGGDVDTRSG